MIRPVAVGSRDGLRVIADADRQHDRSAEPMIVRAVCKPSEDEVPLREAVVDADRGRVLSRGNECRNDQVGPE